MNRIIRRSTIVLACLLIADSGHAEPPVRIESAGLRTVLPNVPQQDPRRAEGLGPDETWRVRRENEQPVAAFVDSLKGSDAALQLIVGQGRILTTRAPIAKSDGAAVIAVGDPTIIDFEVLPEPRMIRVLGKRAGITDLMITTDDKEVYSFEVHVGYDLVLLQARLHQLFPDTLLKLGQIREHLVVQGQARSPAQVAQIMETLNAYVGSVQVPLRTSGQESGELGGFGLLGRRPGLIDADEEAEPSGRALTDEDDRPNTEGFFNESRVINLLRVPGVQQVMLQVRIAELNRTAMREIGADILGTGSNGNIAGTQIAGASTVAGGATGGAEFLGGGGGGVGGTVPGMMNAIAGLAGGASAALGTATTAFGIFPSADFQILLRALRENSVINILAEPNLVTMSGQEASFLAGGEFPVPIPQGFGTGVTVEFKNFGVQLVFVPYVMEDGTIRLHVEPEVSTIDFSIGTTLVVGGSQIPGLNTRRAETTVEMREGQTLAIAGLMEVDLDARTSRIPGLGDLPYLGPLFSNTSHRRVEKELLVLVTPHLVAPLEAGEVGPVPGDNIKDPTDKEFYFLNRIEGRTCQQFNAPTSWDRPYTRAQRMQREQSYGFGPLGFSE